jgi:hypothetical protein
VSVQSTACEGFYVHKANTVEFPRGLTPIRQGKWVETGVQEISQPDSSRVQTISEFLGGEEEAGVMHKWEETQWFMSLLEDLSLFLPSSSLSHAVRLIYVNRLARLWYNFDSISEGRRRPFKTYRRVKTVVEELTWILAKETKSFAENSSLRREGSVREEEAYEELLRRLHLF